MGERFWFLSVEMVYSPRYVAAILPSFRLNTSSDILKVDFPIKISHPCKELAESLVDVIGFGGQNAPNASFVINLFIHHQSGPSSK